MKLFRCNVAQHSSLDYLQIVAALLLVLLPHTSQAQRLDDVPLATQTIAIQSIDITVSPGRTIQNGTVLIENGLISEVGRSISIPSHAEVIDGNGLNVYAGFIDGLSHAGMPAPKQSPRGSSTGPQPQGQRRRRFDDRRAASNRERPSRCQ